MLLIYKWIWWKSTQMTAVWMTVKLNSHVPYSCSHFKRRYLGNHCTRRYMFETVVLVQWLLTFAYVGSWLVSLNWFRCEKSRSYTLHFNQSHFLCLSTGIEANDLYNESCFSTFRSPFFESPPSLKSPFWLFLLCTLTG